MNDAHNQTTEAENSIDEQRALWEQFTFAVCQNGYVNVCNRSHNDDTAHTYSVETRNGRAVSCTCAHARYRGAHCKHQIAVENNPLVASSAKVAGTARGRKEPVRSEQPDFGHGHSDGPELL